MIEGLGKKILVTGSTGFKGSWLTQALVDSGSEVVGIGLAPHTDPSIYTSLGLEDKTNTYFTDIRNYSNVEEIIKTEKPDSVFHLAAQPIVRESYDNPAYTFETNILGTKNVLEAVRGSDSVKSVVVITTDKVYKDQDWVHPYRESDPLGGFDPYSASKACSEIITDSYIQSFFNPEKFGDTHETLVATARAGNVIGGGDWSKDRLIPDIIRALYEGDGEVTLRYPGAVRPWQHVLEPLTGYMMLSSKLNEGNTQFVGAWNFSSEEENAIPVGDVVQKGMEIMGRGTYIVEEQDHRKETNVLKLDSSKAKSYLGWNPTLGLEETLESTFGWYRDFYNGVSPVETTKKQIGEFFEKTSKWRKD